MSEKPFWEGKTCEEMAGLPVKAVFKNGVTITGQLSRFGGIPISTEGMNSPISISSNTLNFRPHREISSVELLDSLEYERVDNIENVQVGDIFVANDGNQYLIDAEDKDDKAATFRAYLSYAGEMWLSNCAFAYALRRKPKLPDHDGLWLDKDGNTWTMRDGSVQCTCIGADNWDFTRMWFSPDSKQVLPSAPFRPAKAEMVEAGKRLVKGDSKGRPELISEWADVLQTLANVAAAFGITDEELAQAMDDCLVHNQERGRM